MNALKMKKWYPWLVVGLLWIVALLTLTMGHPKLI